MIKDIEMVLIDLDGTLLNNNKTIGKADLQTLEYLGKSNVVRAIATGRNYYSALSVLPADISIDYLIFSSGAGIIDWKNRNMLYSSVLEKEIVFKTEKVLKALKVNFSIHFPIPDNHKYFYYKVNDHSNDFNKRNSIYSDYCMELLNGYPLDSATQFLVILDNESDYHFIASQIEGLKVIRATSPIDGISIWLEIFNTDVSKALGGIFLCKKLRISQKATLGIGNDYNDIDLLNWTAKSYMVDNGPDELKQNYLSCCSNQDNPLTMVFKHLI
jgi:Cof subfamily protein (haloacid dehalogenase superfamily)